MAEIIDKSEIFKENQPVFGITDEVFLCLYYFFKTHSNTNTYIVNSFSLEYDENTVNSLRRYGIRFKDTEYDISELETRMQFLIIPSEALNDKVTLTEYVEKNSINTMVPGYCLIESNFNDSVELRTVAQIITSIRPFTIINTDTAEKVSNYHTSSELFEKFKSSTNFETGNKFNLIDITDLFTKFNNTMDINSYIDVCVDIIDKLLHNKISSDDVFFVNYQQISIRGKYAYLSIAAYLLLSHDIKCYVFQNEFSYFKNIVGKARSYSYMFLGDYLNNLQKFPDFSISQKINLSYLWMKDYNTLQDSSMSRDYQITLTMYRAKIDLNNWILLSDFSETVQVPLRRINIKSFYDLCDIGSTDFNAANSDFLKLNSLFNKIEISLIDKRYLPFKEFLSINNVIVFEQAGVNYIAYVSDIRGKLPFIVSPIAKGYTPFSTSVDIKSLANLLDISLFFDAMKFCDFYKKIDSRLKITKHKYDLNSLRGIILLGYPATQNTINKNSLTLNEVGVWAYQTGDFRNSLYNSFISMFDKREMVLGEMLSIYGVKHPQLSTSLLIKDKLWRDN